LKGIGKFLYYFGIGLWSIAKSFGKNIGIAYRNYQERQRIEAQERAHYEFLRREGKAYGHGLAEGIAEVQEAERVRIQNERGRRNALRRLENQMFPDVNENFFDTPKVNESLFTEDLQPRRRKRRKNILEL
jgi:hypothetical protein